MAVKAEKGSQHLPWPVQGSLESARTGRQEGTAESALPTASCPPGSTVWYTPNPRQAGDPRGTPRDPPRELSVPVATKILEVGPRLPRSSHGTGCSRPTSKRCGPRTELLRSEKQYGIAHLWEHWGADDHIRPRGECICPIVEERPALQSACVSSRYSHYSFSLFLPLVTFAVSLFPVPSEKNCNCTILLP